MSNYWVCAQVIDGVCLQWSERTEFFALPEGAGLKIGALLLLCSATAWGVQMTARLLLNR